MMINHQAGQCIRIGNKRNMRQTMSRRLAQARAALPVATLPAPISTSMSTSSDRFRSIPEQSIQAKEIRSRLVKDHVAGGLVFVSAGQPLLRNGMDVFHRYRPNSNFAYLTGGCEEQGAAVLLDTTTGTTTLLLAKQEDDMVFWMGPQPTADEVAAKFGADRVAYTSDLAHILREQHAGQDVHVSSAADKELVMAALQGRQTSGSDTSSQDDEQGASSTRVLDGLLPDVINRLRSIKTDAEVACLLRASQVSAAAHMDTWAACRPGMHEFQLEAAFTSSCMHQGLMALGYPCIVGAGTNSAILHYETNRSQVGPQDLVLIDAGAEFRCYTADITRTFPAGGKFTPQQRDVYNAVLDSQELALGQIKCGAVLKEVEQQTRQLLLARLQDMDVVSKGTSSEALLAADIDRVFMPHGLGHFLGLDVHDVSDTGPVPRGGLQPGHVVTVEPGLYFIPALLGRAAGKPEQAALINWDVLEAFKGLGGVRIEDNVLVMDPEDGHSFNLTMAAGVPKQAQLVEECMQQRRA